eukprot:m.112714 g.112714  ORF g.112714 m.112714 type:complete len:94 (-) comp13484_c0_seq8:1059-1340(-)
MEPDQQTQWRALCESGLTDGVPTPEQAAALSQLKKDKKAFLSELTPDAKKEAKGMEKEILKEFAKLKLQARKTVSWKLRIFIQLHPKALWPTK